MSTLELVGILVAAVLLMITFDLVLALSAEERRIAALVGEDVAEAPWQSRPRILERPRK